MAERTQDADPRREIRDRALALLARREHSQSELGRKLACRGYPREDIDAVLSGLRDADAQSDRRFAEAYVSVRIRKGHGPLKIRAGLRERGVDDALVAEALASPVVAQAVLDRAQRLEAASGGPLVADAWDLADTEALWRVACEATRQTRFGAARPAARGEFLRQARHLVARGFSESQVRAVLRTWD